MATFARRVLHFFERAYIIALILAALGFAVAELILPDDKIASWINANPQTVLFGLMGTLIVGGVLILSSLTRIEGSIELDLFARLRKRIGRLHGSRAAVVEPYLERAVRQLEYFFEAGIFELRGKRTFQDFWIDTIGAHPGADILATSLPSNNYFWNAEDLIEVMERNVKAGGRVKRLFFLQHDGPPTPEELAVMREHQAIHVEVYYCDKNRLALNERDLVLVDARLRFGWKAEVSVDDIQLAQVYTREQDLKILKDRLERLFGDESLVTRLPAA